LTKIPVRKLWYYNKNYNIFRRLLFRCKKSCNNADKLR